MNSSYHHVHIHSRHCGHSQYSPSTKSADISRLLDPSYASSSSASSSYTQTRVYVDHDGHLHDPDFREFPVASSPTKSARTKRRASSSFSDSYLRPTWQQLPILDDALADEEEDDEPQTSSSRRSSFNTGSSPSSSYNYFTPSTSPSSYTSGESWLSGNHLDFSESPKSPKKLLKSNRRSSFDSDISNTSSLGYDDGEYEHEDSDAEVEVASPTSPTCKDTLRKEFASMALQMQVGVFRMKKKVKQAMNRT